ncbi:MAG: carbamoyltransferase HypF [Lentisphaeria bacterium]|nr:carbamoyltransferase HypF [Lentisphaeria bacterium]
MNSTGVSTTVFRIYGVVQGVGFRPFVSRIAVRAGLAGSVANKGSYVEVHAQGEPEALKAFRLALEHEAPPRSAILKIMSRVRMEPPYPTFEIIESEHETGDIFVSPDIATCDLCKKELFDPSDRRYLHPFINCTACGPRLTILDAMPYDRERTSMGEFPMCPQCETEYTSPESRRYDAQPVCCHDCGPEVYLIGRPERGTDAITSARRAILDGRIVAIKGIGGFHLCCNARDAAAVARLRELKHRPMKPFAVMMNSLETVRRECAILPGQEEILDGHQKPIILLQKRPESTLPDVLAPGNPTLGVMLPYAPVQMLLFHFNDDLTMPDCLVMTSGNVSGAPICRSDEDALAEIAGFCDVILSHNRKIRLRADDSVMDWLDGRPYMIRRSRGYAPLPFFVSGDFRGQVLGIGGELKNTFCLANGGLFYPSPYIGDMEDLRTARALRESVARMSELLEMKPQAVCCDLHPKYNSSAVAGELGIPVLKIQHHYAHVLSCMVENDCMDEVIGVSFDGTGYGTDGTIWGGEFLVSSPAGFTRAGHIKPFLQAGGDASAREGWRIAVSMIAGMFPAEDTEGIVASLALCAPGVYKFQKTMLDRKLNCVVSTSAGRLFDAVSAILGIRKSSTFEGEASMSLQFAAEAWNEAHPGQAENLPPCPDFDRDASGAIILPTDSLVRDIVRARLNGADSGMLAALFHSRLANMIAKTCEAIREESGLNACALTGGVFQNRLLTTLCAGLLRAAGFRVLLHGMIPPNDGGIGAGQALAAMYHLNHPEKHSSISHSPIQTQGDGLCV